MWIPDAQVKPGVPLDHLDWAGQYMLAKRPDVVICAGDFSDLPSLSIYDEKGSKQFEGRRYKDDIKAVQKGMELLLGPLHKFNIKAAKEHRLKYEPRLVMLMGNHEDRITRAVNRDPTHLEGIISLADLKYESWGWEVVPFLKPINIDGIVYCHYFCSGVMGKAIQRAQLLLTKKHMSCVVGHLQGRDIAYGQRADGKTITALIAGSFYQHEEEFLNNQTNNHWRGIYILHDVHDGIYDEMPVSLAYLKGRYGK
jgi:hypothetical protein